LSPLVLLVPYLKNALNGGRRELLLERGTDGTRGTGRDRTGQMDK